MRRLTPADVAHRPLPGTTVPSSASFSPDGRALTYLLAEPGTLEQRLHAVDVATGRLRTLATPGAAVEEGGLPVEERLRRERARELAVGVTRASWAAAADRVLVPMADGLWVVDGIAAGTDGPVRHVVDAAEVGGPLLDARISDDGSVVAYVAGDEVHVCPVGGRPVTVTSGAAAVGRTHGTAEYVAQEEMGRGEGFWLSPDAAHVAFCEVDEAHIPIYRIVHQGSDRVGPAAQEDHRYPFAGAENARVRVGVVPADGSGRDRPRWLDLDATGIGDDRYVARVDWASPTRLVVQLQDRTQRRLDVVAYDIDIDIDAGAGAGAGVVPGTLLWSEASDVWVNLHDLLRPLPDGALLWASERTGFRNLEVREADGSHRCVLTSTEWVVTDVLGVGGGEVWFASTEGSPLERHVWRAPLDGSGPPVRVSDADGVHGGTAHPATGAWVDVHTSLGSPPRTVLRTPTGDHVLHDGADDPRVAELGLRPPALRTVAADDGTALHAAVYRPDGEGPWPLVVWVYGGPHVQQVRDTWSLTVALRAQLLRQEGIAVAVVDNRGSWDRGLAFEAALRWRLGTVEVDDQIRLVEALVADGTADPDRVGVYGWSYGGYLSLMCLARRPDVFRAACAGAPVTAWDGYDTHYTERYLGTPQENPEGYADGSVLAHVEGLRDRDLLLVHGLIDENVHFRHTARLVQSLVTRDIDHRLLLYPQERHMPRSEADRTSMERRIVDFLHQTLAR